MNSLANFMSHFNDFYGGINGTTFTGAIDVIVVEQPDGSFTCSPFHVRFGKLGILHSKEKIVDVLINDVPLDFHMKLGDSGEAFFVEKVDEVDKDNVSVPANLITSPILADIVTPENMVDGFAIENVQKKDMKPPADETDKVDDSPNEISAIHPKVFCAETSEVKLTEKISSFHGEFRPIDEDKVSAEMDSDSSLELTIGTEKTRRKKKTHLRKRSEGKIAKVKDEEEKVIFAPAVIDTGVTDFHFFSDSEAAPEPDSSSMRVHAILSDSEVDKKSGDESQTDNTSWKWGELPTPPQQKEVVAKAASPEEESPSRRSMLGSMFSFMKKTRSVRNNPVELPPETTPEKPKTDEATPPEDDTESGCGASPPQSPDDASRIEEVVKSIAMSLCGNLEAPKEEDFAKKLVTWEDLVKNYKIVEDPNLVVRFDGKFYNWRTVCPMLFSVVVFNRLLPKSSVDALCEEYMPKKVATSYWWGLGRDDKKDASVKKPEVPEVKPEEPLAANEKNAEIHRKVLRLTSEQISRLDLKPGQNEVVFSITSAYQGTTQCKCHIYRWRYDDRIVVSDIDGTITKSDVLGHILPILGRDWAQSGVAQLFTKIKRNGYQLLYLSARAIAQATTTRDYLKSIKQQELSLPEGPVLLSPTGLLNALHREVIDKRPEDFKIPCLKDIQSLFPEGHNPFYAGYGNKVNDVWSYRAVGIPMYRIFTINHRGELKHEFTQTFQTTYSNLSFIVDHVFPSSTVKQQPDHYSSFVYWRQPLEEVVIDPVTKKVVEIKTEAVTKAEE